MTFSRFMPLLSRRGCRCLIADVRSDQTVSSGWDRDPIGRAPMCSTMRVDVVASATAPPIRWQDRCLVARSPAQVALGQAGTSRVGGGRSCADQGGPSCGTPAERPSTENWQVRLSPLCQQGKVMPDATTGRRPDESEGRRDPAHEARWKVSNDNGSEEAADQQSNCERVQRQETGPPTTKTVAATADMAPSRMFLIALAGGTRESTNSRITRAA